MTLTGYAWVCLSVRDLELSADWYQQSLGLEVLMTNADTCALDADDRFTYLVDHTSFCVLGLQQRADNHGRVFHPKRTGLDHLTFSLAQGDLNACQQRLQRSGIAFEGPTRWQAGSFIELADPDGIPIRLFDLG